LQRARVFELAQGEAMAKAEKNDKTAEDAARTMPPEQIQARVVWDDNQMQTTFANVINVIHTREEFTLLYGTNQTWNPIANRELTVKLNNRIVLTPYAAKRMLALLSQHVTEYEQRFGAMNLDT
jgi:hypothetical protein